LPEFSSVLLHQHIIRTGTSRQGGATGTVWAATLSEVRDSMFARFQNPSPVTPRLWRAKDYVRTAEGFYFAVLSQQLEAERIPASLRYITRANHLQKVSTAEAVRRLRDPNDRLSDYWYYSRQRDCHLAGVPTEQVAQHFCPERALRRILEHRAPDSAPWPAALPDIVGYLADSGVDTDRLGLTGSWLINAAGTTSDIDLVVYDRSAFQCCRAAIKRGISAGMLQPLNETDWQTTYARRGCWLDFPSYVWHERRKCNKALYGGVRFDISLVDPAVPDTTPAGVKEGWTTIRSRVANAELSYDWPARYQLDHHRISEIVSYTATYFGQAETGERIEARGLVETSSNGVHRLILGATREASSAYLRVV
jgi:predicted nucleotidyltransferase